jgi:hypothetical protein
MDFQKDQVHTGESHQLPPSSVRMQNLHALPTERRYPNLLEELEF